MAAIERISTTSVAQTERLEFWNRIASETFAGLIVDSERETFNAEMLRWTLGDLTLIRPRSPAAVVQRRPEDSINLSDWVILHFQHSGRSLHRQCGHVCELGVGDFVLADSNEYYRLDLSADHEMLVAEMPRVAIQSRMPHLEDALSRRIPGGTPSGRLLHDFLLSLWRQGDQSHADPSWRDGVGNVFLDLLTLSLESRDAVFYSDRSLLERLTALVAARLSDPDLRTSLMAAELGVSVRTVQNAFASIGTTPSAYVLDRRLECAGEQLVANPKQSITAIAYDVGFNDCGYFTRCFRQKFGVSASVYRARR